MVGIFTGYSFGLKPTTCSTTSDLAPVGLFAAHRLNQ
jgi:hypothetical protein